MKARCTFILITAASALITLGWPVRAGQSSGQVAPAAPSGQVLTMHTVTDDSYVGWFATSFADDGETRTTWRFRGDTFSKFYYLVQGNTAEVRSEEGALLARLPAETELLAARKTSNYLALIQYHGTPAPLPPLYERRLPIYELALIEHGKARVYRCQIDLMTFEAMSGRRYRDDGTVGDDSALLIVKALEEAEPALARDHCAMISNGVRPGRDDALKPALTKPFPRVGDVFVPDGQGLKSGWIYGGGGNRYGPNRRYCCTFSYRGDGRDTFMVVRPLSYGYRVQQIFFVDGYVRRSSDCMIDGEQAVVAVADNDWKNGRAYFIDGETVRIVRWSDHAPKQCGPS